MGKETLKVVLEAELVSKIARERDRLANTKGHEQSYCRGFLEALEWIQEQLPELRKMD